MGWGPLLMQRTQIQDTTHPGEVAVLPAGSCPGASPSGQHSFPRHTTRWMRILHAASALLCVRQCQGQWTRTAQPPSSRDPRLNVCSQEQ
ncbi:hypothetical protein GDO81_010306 [Engystomops pustulosus]|uniref:Uncharacterized protein n=1 Tax=Engystomops pustulosus TaxID=76066 RepID=A0AAV7BZG6_ENGPU|nr:hypothetical protein GDO81_010306 [Engystomops pustulosus]